MSSLSQADLTALNGGPSQYKHPSNWGYKTGFARCVFSATDGLKVAGSYSMGLVLPKGCTVTKAYYKVLTTFTSATDAATIALSLVSANDIVSAVAISTGTTWDAAGCVIAIPTGAMTNELAITTADSTVTATVAVETLTAGKLVLFLEWVYTGDLDLT